MVITFTVMNFESSVSSGQAAYSEPVILNHQQFFVIQYGYLIVKQSIVLRTSKYLIQYDYRIYKFLNLIVLPGFKHKYFKSNLNCQSLCQQHFVYKKASFTFSPC